MTNTEFILEIKNLNKSFPGVKALADVDFNVKRGEVHALMGENGAGKSTLIKILTGIYKKDSGEIIFSGKKLDHLSALEAQHMGISTIYQELNLIPDMTIWENIYLGREIKKYGIVKKKAMIAGADEILKSMGIDIEKDIDSPLNKQSVAIQQLVAIARAISIDVKLLVMDEPTSSFTEKEVEILFNVIRKLKKNNISIIFISHRISEIFRICDTVTVLKNGYKVAQMPVTELTPLKLVSLMIGRDACQIINKVKGEYRKVKQNILLNAKNIKSNIKVKDMSLEINEGEVVGISGLLGSGRTEFAKALYADEKIDSGEMIFCGQKTHFKSPRDSVKKGFAFCSEDRKSEGIFPNMTVQDNMTIAIIDKISKFGFISKKKQKQITQEYVNKLDIKTPSVKQMIKNLSGGNQQKVLLARWLCTEPKLLILDEPTRGIDVGAKDEIEELIRNTVKEGVSVMMISSELHELTNGCDRVAVIKDGRWILELMGEEITEDNLMYAIAKGKETTGL